MVGPRSLGDLSAGRERAGRSGAVAEATSVARRAACTASTSKCARAKSSASPDSSARAARNWRASSSASRPPMPAKSSCTASASRIRSPAGSRRARHRLCARRSPPPRRHSRNADRAQHDDGHSSAALSRRLAALRRGARSSRSISSATSACKASGPDAPGGSLSRRQPAKSRPRPLARDEAETAHPRRTDAGRGCRRESRNPQNHPPPREGGTGRADDFQRPAGSARHERPHRGDARRHDRRDARTAKADAHDVMAAALGQTGRRPRR